MAQPYSSLDQVNIQENLPGVEDDYYRCSASLWRVAIGWIELLLTLGVIAANILTGFAMSPGLSDQTAQKVHIASFIVGSALTALQIFKTHAQSAIIARENDLKKLILAYHSADSKSA